MSLYKEINGFSKNVDIAFQKTVMTIKEWKVFKKTRKFRLLKKSQCFYVRTDFKRKGIKYTEVVSVCFNQVKPRTKVNIDSQIEVK